MSQPIPIPPPIFLSLILCEKAIKDAMTGQYSLVGLLQHVPCRRFPTVIPQVCIFFELTNGRGSIPILIRIADCSEDHPPIYQTTMTLELTDPLLIAHGCLAIANAAFQEPGQYRFQLYVAGHLLAERRLFLEPAAPPQPPPEGGW